MAQSHDDIAQQEPADPVRELAPEPKKAGKDAAAEAPKFDEDCGDGRPGGVS